MPTYLICGSILFGHQRTLQKLQSQSRLWFSMQNLFDYLIWYSKPQLILSYHSFDTIQQPIKT